MNDTNANADLNVHCNDRERIFLDGSPAEWAALEAHAAACPACAEQIHGWKSLSLAAAELRDYSDTASLWPRIHRSLVEHAARAEQNKSRPTWQSFRPSFLLSWQTLAATAIVVLLAGSGAWYRWHIIEGPKPARQSSDLLHNNALAEVERTESAYMHAIDTLAAAAKPQLDHPETPLLTSYREKLLVLDSAIEDLRAQAGQNPSNAHLRYQLLAMYQEKQRTLEEVLEVKQ
jgi:hypothetical protein